jgi:hypothetical protein
MAELGLSGHELRKTVNVMLRAAKENAVLEGTWNLPENYGDILLEREATDEEIKAMLAAKRREGVRNEDIRSWWNRHDLQRRMVLEEDDFRQFKVYKTALDEKGKTPDEAASWVMKFLPIYGEPHEMSEEAENDRPLPYELRHRVTRYAERRAAADVEEYLKDIINSTSFNALVRKEIRAGNI